MGNNNIHAIMVVLLPDYGSTEMRVRMHSTTFVTRKDAEHEMNLLRVQNLPLKMWLVEFPDPRD